MANAVVTISGNYIDVVFNDLFISLNGYVPKEGRYNKTFLSIIENKSDHVRLTIDGETWNLSHTGANNTILIDTVGGVTPTTVDHLYTLLKTMIS